MSVSCTDVTFFATTIVASTTPVVRSEAVRCRCLSLWKGLLCKVYSRPWISVSVDRLPRWSCIEVLPRWAKDVLHLCSCCWRCGRGKSVHNVSAGRIPHSWYRVRLLSAVWVFRYKCLWIWFPQSVLVIRLHLFPCGSGLPLVKKREELYTVHQKTWYRQTPDLQDEPNKHPTLIVYMCAPFCKGADTYNNGSIILFHPLSVEILAIFVF